MNTNISTRIRIFFIWTAFLLFLSCSSSKTSDVKMVDGKLRPCPDSPNCVSSESNNESSQIEPFTFQGSPEKAWNALKESIVIMKGKIQEEHNDYLRVIFTSKWFKFIDDVECRMVSSEGVIHIRSGSRMGYSDFGVNKKRAEKLRSIFNQKKDK